MDQPKSLRQGYYHSTLVTACAYLDYRVEKDNFCPSERKVLDTLLVSIGRLKQAFKESLKKVLVYQIAALLFANQVLHLQ